VPSCPVRRCHFGLLAAALLVLTACAGAGGGDDAGSDSVVSASSTPEEVSTSSPSTATSIVIPTLETVELDAEIRPGVEQLAVLDASPGLELQLNTSEDGASDGSVATGTVDEMGSLLFRRRTTSFQLKESADRTNR